jgi:hypothetical protein
MTPEQLADAILRAAGSKLEHYDPVSQGRIIEAARAGCGDILRPIASLFPSGAGYEYAPDANVIAFYIRLSELRAAKALFAPFIGGPND